MRTQFFRAAAVAAVAALALAACGSSSKASSSTPTTNAPGTTATTATTAPTATTVAPAAGPATVDVAANAGLGKSILVDSAGLTLYVWDSDTTAGKADCTGQCAANWPPLDVSGTPTYGTGLTASMFSEVTGPNGEKQLAVNGKPLYRWVNDKAAGDATGQGVNGFHVVGADGNKIT